MISDDFIFNISTKYKDRKDEDRNEVFKQDLYRFVDKVTGDYFQELYDHIPQFHQYSTPFDVWKLENYAIEKGYVEKRTNTGNTGTYYKKCLGFSLVSIHEEKNGKKTKRFDHIKCDTKYSKVSGGCPNCHSTNSEHVEAVENMLPESVVLVKEDCHKCDHFLLSHSENLSNDVHGPTCGQYENNEYPNKSCGQCKCKACCEAYTQYNENPYRYVNQIKENNVDPMVWINPNMVQGSHIREQERLKAPVKKGSSYKKPSFFGVDIESLAKSKRMNK